MTGNDAELNIFLRIKEVAEHSRREADRAAGAMRAVEDAAKKEFGASSRSELERKLAKVGREADAERKVLKGKMKRLTDEHGEELDR